MKHNANIPYGLPQGTRSIMATIAYMRVSTDDQTIDNQRHQITAKGYQIDRAFIDEAVSGSINAASREGFKAMLE